MIGVTMSSRFAVVRAAVLSVDEVEAMSAGDGLVDPRVTAAIDLAVGSHVLRKAESPGRARTTVLRYLQRMGGRATPYGLFAGTASADIDVERRLELRSYAQHRVRVRLDVVALQNLLSEAFAEAALERWPVRCNPSLRFVNGHLRYAKRGDATADLVTVRSTLAIEAVVEVFGRRTLIVQEALDAMMDRFPAVPRDALREFMATLVDNDLLCRSLDLIQPGIEPIDLARSLLDRLGDRRRAAIAAELDATLRQIRHPTVSMQERLRVAWRTAAQHDPSLERVPPSRRFNVDLELALREHSLDERTVLDLTDTLRRLELVFSPTDHLREFRLAFRKRHEDAEVPLLEALDLESGVLASPERGISRLAERAGVRAPASSAPPPALPIQVLQVLDRWLHTREDVDIKDFPMAEVPTSRGVHAALLDNYRGRFHSLLRAGYRRNSLALIARFALGRPDLTEKLRVLVRDELQVWDGPGAGPIHAELSYGPGTRIGNVLIRPQLFEGSIALTGGGGGTLGLDRLLIRLDGDTLRLRDADSGRDVIVELSSAHNVQAAALDPLYRFLGLLASPGAIVWSWGALGRLSHFPRVTCGSVIITPEAWRLEGKDVADVVASADPAAALRRRLAGLGDRRWVGVGPDDRLLPIDATSSRSVLTALARYRSQRRVEVVEMPHVECPAITGPSGKHVGEIAVPLPTPRPAGTRTPLRRPVLAHHDPAALSSWVYFRYYCGTSVSDAVVLRARATFSDLLAEGSADEWFFVRYGDDGHHVRVRVRVSAAGARANVVAALDALGLELRQAGQVGRVAMDDYVPEIARYGGAEGLRRAEALFSADSMAVAHFLTRSPTEEQRLYQCVADVLHWNSRLTVLHDEQHDFLRSCQEGLSLSFERGNQPFERGNQHGRLFREHRARLDDHLHQSQEDVGVGERLDELTSTVVARQGPGIAQRVVASALHLHCNRLYQRDARRLEYLAYDIAQRKVREFRARGSALTRPDATTASSN